MVRCFQWFKDTKMKANHNCRRFPAVWHHVVSNGSKILKWKQITTIVPDAFIKNSCFQWFKDTKMKANHNWCAFLNPLKIVVSNGSKILKWKQITTWRQFRRRLPGCFQWFKDTKMKANHNQRPQFLGGGRVVSNGSKILKWKQITTKIGSLYELVTLFPMVQRY